MKQCSQCKEWKDESEFSKDKYGIQGLRSNCKLCCKAYRDSHKEQIKEYGILYNKKNKDKIKEYNQRRYKTKEHKEYHYNFMKSYNEKHKEENRKYQKAYYEQNKQYILQRCKNYRETNKEVIQQRDKLRYNKNKLTYSFGSAICKSLKGAKAEQHWEDLVPYNLQQLKEHLEKQFDENMDWDNYGTYWEIDHIIPQNMFIFDNYNDSEFLICWSLVNLRPLERLSNRRRPKDGSDIPKEQAISILGLDLYCDMMGVENKGGL